MLAAVRDGRIIQRANMFGLLAARRARAAGIPAALVAHEDVYVLRKQTSSSPPPPAVSAPASALWTPAAR